MLVLALSNSLQVFVNMRSLLYAEDVGTTTRLHFVLSDRTVDIPYDAVVAMLPAHVILTQDIDGDRLAVFPEHIDWAYVDEDGDLCVGIASDEILIPSERVAQFKVDWAAYTDSQ